MSIETLPLAAHIYVALGMIGIAFFMMMLLDMYLEKKAEKKDKYHKSSNILLLSIWILITMVQGLIFYMILI